MTPALFLLALAGAPDFQSTALIDTAVQQFTGHAIGDEGGAITRVDTRLKLAACPLPQLEWRGSTKDAVVVRCMAPVWRIYVPVRAAAVAAPRPMMAAAAPVPVAPAAKPEIVVKRGDPVTVEAGSAGFSITRDGVAMGDAAKGARLMVKVDPAKPPIQAVAVDAGRVTLPGWGN
ncbi:flagella basal body P-ring formation protein FlgA [Sphingomonas sp. Y38-1Y]|uniref:flagella basal body P-ring formation protein FlgA n=1 Tax=Sphingomonas sp. Y38-1Y TaxID=3078265 RepID=UPI0028EEB9E3|nr:flagella basal body P-ring formation protein FlgA [Sphingomonas sp. Y38-1Y]